MESTRIREPCGRPVACAGLSARLPGFRQIRTLAACALLPAVPLAAADIRYVGLTPRGTRIQASVVPGPSPDAPTVLLIGGLYADGNSSRVVSDETRRFDATRQSRRAFRLIAIPNANPDGARLQFPPSGAAYRDNAESHALWRWIALQGPDLVVLAGGVGSGLAEALAGNAPAGIGRVPVRTVGPKSGILRALPQRIPPSELRRQLDRRRARTPRQLAEELARVYGHDFDPPTYIPGMALIAQLRLGNRAEVERLAAPYVTGAKDSLGPRPNSLLLAGHLVFAELAQRTGDPRYLALVRKAAGLGFAASGEMKESMPFHDQMSDSVFMGASIAARAGSLTGERRYFDLAARHLAFMDKLVLRPDGLYRHSPLADAAWGRGNAFPALGLALTLSDFPKDHPEFPRILASYRRLMETLAPFQDPDGMWHQVIDQPASYAETSATSMLAFSMLRGIRSGWLDAPAFQPRVNRAWSAVLARVASDGVLIDVCESTNKQPTLQHYLNRAALLGRDPRGGAMALLLATELE